MRCERCASSRLHWFTPQNRAAQGAAFLCARCAHLTILSRRAVAAAEARRASSQPQQAAA
jgi:hypothetical protein